MRFHVKIKFFLTLGDDFSTSSRRGSDDTTTVISSEPSMNQPHHGQRPHHHHRGVGGPFRLFKRKESRYILHSVEI